MRKIKAIIIFLINIGILTIFPMFTTAAQDLSKVTNELQSGISIDCARRYYTVEEIKHYIDILSANNNSFLQLHLSDNENVGIECETLGQIVEYARLNSDGSYTNIQTQKKFLSNEQIREILQYAKEKGVEIIPEIDMPGHMSGFFELAKNQNGSEYLQEIAVNQNEVPGELNITTDLGKALAKNLLAEYTKLFAGCTYFHMGCDEYWTNWGDRMITFINSQAEYLKNQGYIVRIWNDLLKQDTMKKIDKNIQVVYWSYDGATNDEQIREERIKERASVPQLQEEGFQIILTNAYYLYFVPAPWNTDQYSLDYTVKDIKEQWSLEKWDGNHEGGLNSYQNIIGAMIGVWGENSEGVSENTIRTQTENMYNAMVSKVITVKVENTEQSTNELTTEVCTEKRTFETITETEASTEQRIIEQSTTMTTQQQTTNSVVEKVVEKRPAKVTWMKKKLKGNSVTLIWKNQKNIDGYLVYQYNSKSKKYKLYKKCRKNKITIRKLRYGKIYKFKIRAYRKKDTKIYYGKYSNVVKIKVKK